MEWIEKALWPSVVLLLQIILILANMWVFKKLKTVHSEGNVVKNSINIFVVLVGTLAFILTLPIENALKGQIVTFLGILVSAGIALSSTTLLGNLFAGIMNQSMNRFRNGDLIKMGEIRGRVVRTGSFHAEIQLEDSNFMTIPNIYIANHPVKLIRKSNTVISTTVSLGYDVPRHTIVDALKEAALVTGLTDPYVYITQLGDFSVSYKIHGFLNDSSKFFSTASQLNAHVMDKLHEQQIEIVSPTFMNQRRADETIFIPKRKPVEKPGDVTESPEELIFDEAIKSEKIEKKKDFLIRVDEHIQKMKEQLKETEDEAKVADLKKRIEHNEQLKAKIEESIKEHKEENNGPA